VAGPRGQHFSARGHLARGLTKGIDPLQSKPATLGGITIEPPRAAGWPEKVRNQEDSNLDIKVNTRALRDGAQAVEIQGEIDVYTSPRVKETVNELIEKGFYHLIINLEGVRYIDSTGLGVLIGALKKVREQSGRILLVCTNPQIKKIFNITGLVKIFEIFKDEEEAVQVLAAAK
jgi:anti-sigma B factor antagonist